MNLKRRQIFWLLVFLGLGFILRLNNISERSLWTDEFFSLFLSSGHGVDSKNYLDYLSGSRTPILTRAKDFKVFLANDSSKAIADVSRGMLYTDTHPPLYFWIMHLWMKLLGDTVFSIRFFSVLLGMLSIVLAYKVTRQLFEEQAALFAAILVSISAFAVRYSQEARAYSFILALGLTSWLFLLRFEKFKKDYALFLFSIFNGLGLYAHYFYGFIILAQFIYFMIVYRKDSKVFSKFLLAFLSSWLIFIPWYLRIAQKGYNFHLTEWIFGYPSFLEKIYYSVSGAIRYVFIFNPAKGSPYSFIAGIILMVLIALVLKKETFPKYPKQSLFCLVMFLFPLLAMFLIDILEYGALLRQERFWMFSFLGFIPLAGYILNYAFNKSKVVIAILMFFILISALAAARLQFGPAPEYTSSWINKESHGKTSAVIVYNIRSAVFAQSYYLDNDIYLLPVSDNKQLSNAVTMVSNLVDKIFIVRHYHRTDASLMNQPFMEIKNIDPAFKFKAAINEDDISVSEYVKCES